MMNTLAKGIFWIKTPENIREKAIVFKIPVDKDGNLLETDALLLNSKNKDNYNHKKTWETLGKKDTGGYSFDYYPRGRVEINRGHALIYANPNICNEDLTQWAREIFQLTLENGITEIVMKSDYSEHYKCYLD